GTDQAHHFADGRCRISQVVDEAVRHHDVEQSLVVGQMFAIATFYADEVLKTGFADIPIRELKHLAGEIDGDDSHHVTAFHKLDRNSRRARSAVEYADC